MANAFSTTHATAAASRRTARPLRAGFSAVDVIAKKRDGGQLSREEIGWLVHAFTRGQVTAYQMSAFAMAVYLRGMSTEETAALTLSMAGSGKRLSLGRRGGPKVDKHSTGGVGDKVSIALAPLVAACGVRVPMIAGRGLGYTGGTLDKLEAIPGFSTQLSRARFARVVAAHGFALGAATPDLAPADRKLYALRDVTGTVESIPLITASILSKKLCADLDALVLDLKVGEGAFMKTLPRARELARELRLVGKAAGLSLRVLLTRMEAPLGRTVGNALETAEAFALLSGQAPDDLLECTLALGAEMLVLGGRAKARGQAEKQLLAALESGEAAARMRRVVAAQGGDPRVVDEPDRLPQARVKLALEAELDGYVQSVSAREVAEVALRLGAGRMRADDAIDPRAGVELLKKPGERVRRGEPFARLHAGSTRQAEAQAERLRQAYRFGARAVAQRSIVIERR